MVRLQEGNWHKERISLEFGQELLLPELVLPPLTGALVIVTPPQNFIMTLSTLALSMGVILYYFKGQLRMSPLSQ